MRSRRALIGAVLLTAFMLGGVASVAAAHSTIGSASSAHPGATSTLTVTVGTGFVFSLSADQITPGDTVTVTLVSVGTTVHTFTLSPIPNFLFNATDSTAHIDAFFAAHHPLVNLEENGTVGEKHTQTFVAPAYGEYEYICNQSGHFLEGMFGQLGSGEPGSSSTPITGPGWQVFAIGGGIAALVVATIVLAFVIGARPGSRHEMPPERLGYPETPPDSAASHPSH
jgi:plastocyanin